METQTLQSAEEILAAVQHKFGFVPNVLKEASRSRAALGTYVIGQAFIEHSHLTPQEAQAAQLAISAYNGCGYCTSAHSAAGRRLGISSGDLEAMRSGAQVTDQGLKSVVGAVRLILEKQGRLTAEDLAHLAGQGVDRPRLYDLVTLVGLKTISNYVNHISHVPLDRQFEAVD